MVVVFVVVQGKSRRTTTVNPQTSFPSDTVCRSKNSLPVLPVLAQKAAGRLWQNLPPGGLRRAGGAIPSLCNYPKRNLCQRAVMAGDPIGRVTVYSFHASDRAVNAAESRQAQLGYAAQKGSGGRKLLCAGGFSHAQTKSLSQIPEEGE